MRLCFDPVMCPKAVLPAALKIAKAAGFDAMVLHCAFTASSPFHPDASVRMIRDYFDDAGVALMGLHVRDDPGSNFRQVEWDIHLARALRLRCASFLSGARSREAREALVSGVHALLENIPDVTLNIGNGVDTCLENAADFDVLMPDLPERAHIWLNAMDVDNAVGIVDKYVERMGMVTIGEDDVDVVLALKANGYDGPVVLNATGGSVADLRVRVEGVLT
ncbi:MAG: hypothetical protein OXG87_16145 [Gemmatimonadetes bacterium]|nr:hypothetical protein [Gemmatimonadota bacterium]